MTTIILQAVLDEISAHASDFAADHYGVDDLLFSTHPRSSLPHVARVFISVGAASSEDELRNLNRNLIALVDVANQFQLAVADEIDRRELIADGLDPEGVNP